ncbi:MAG: ArsA family ATPase, partial [Anaerolineales bacterium]|nr:ArsA family ATPase [Anaerolineales bacterium]
MSLKSLVGGEQRVIMFGGKGGVGKTTSSAATALHYARAGKRTLIVSSDLSPSLSDIFECQVGQVEAPVKGVDNLWGLEISQDEVMRRWRTKFGDEIYAAASAIVDLSYDEIVDYVAIAPGIQEEFMLDYILERVRDGRYEMVIWDTAPAGDTLRLLELPYKLLSHLKMAPRIYLRVRDNLNLDKTPFSEIIEGWSKLSGEIVDWFREPDNVSFVLVTVPEALGVYQSRRLVDQFARFGLDIRHMIINRVVVEADCDFHRERQTMQLPYLELLRGEYGQRMELVEVP